MNPGLFSGVSIRIRVHDFFNPIDSGKKHNKVKSAMALDFSNIMLYYSNVMHCFIKVIILNINIVGIII